MNEVLQELHELKRLVLASYKQTLTIEEAAEFTGLTISWLYNLTHTKQIPHYKRGRKLYFDRSELDEWLRGEKIDSVDTSTANAEIYDYLNN